MAATLHTVVETPRSLKDAEFAGLREDDRRAIVDIVAANPDAGDEVQGSGGVRKLRIGTRSRGKSGGYRVMVAYLDDTIPAYLLAVLSKSDRADFDRNEIVAMKAVTTAIKRHWRERNRR